MTAGNKQMLLAEFTRAPSNYFLSWGNFLAGSQCLAGTWAVLVSSFQPSSSVPSDPRQTLDLQLDRPCLDSVSAQVTCEVSPDFGWPNFVQCHSLLAVFTGTFRFSRGPSSLLEWSVPVLSQESFLGRSDPPVTPSRIPTITSAPGISTSQKAMWWNWPSNILTWSHRSPASMTMLRYVHRYLGQGVAGDGNLVATTYSGFSFTRPPLMLPAKEREGVKDRNGWSRFWQLTAG